MDWVQPTFSQEYSAQPRKRQKFENKFRKPDFPSYNSHSKLPLLTKGVSWIDKYAPTSKNELIVHKKKVDEVESWLNSINEEGMKILLLTGAPGSGKLTTLSVLCKGLKIQVSEWITPPAQAFDPENFNESYCSQQRSFEEFIIRASRYSSVLSTSSSKRIVVVKDVPNVFIKDPSVFHEFLEKFKTCDGISIVFIVAESSLIIDLFPESVKNVYNVKVINFNPITKKSIVSALTLIMRKEKFGSSSEANVISEISEMCDGDLRNAIMSLNFVRTKKSGISQEGFTRKTKSKVDTSKASSLKQVMTDPSIDLFHGLGRVLYTKRNENGQLSHNPNNIVDSFISCTNTFINMLQENYLNIFSDITSVSQAANFLSLSDYLLSDMKNDNSVSRDLALSNAVRGAMHYNRDPIKKFQQFNKSKYSKAIELNKSYSDCIKANFYCCNPNSIILDNIYLHKMSKQLDNDSQRNIVKDLSYFYLMDKNFS